MLPTVTWFRNPHEHSVHYVKFGLMQMARAGEIRLRERENHSATGLLPPFVQTHIHRRTAVVQVEDGRYRRLAVLDGEDSIFQTSPLIEHCDFYFSCSYHRRFFEGEAFDLALPWQTECELDYYRSLYNRLQHRFQTHLPKGRPLMPIGPAMEEKESPDWIRRKLAGLRHRVSLLNAPWLDWPPQYDRFQPRWARLMQLRQLNPVHDVVLKDSLWGWPRHRVALHRRLQQLPPDYSIHAELHHREAYPFELGSHPAPEPGDFPIVTGGGVTGDYETMLAQSRLGVFATGFHYGCRNITTLAWLLGLRTLCDPISFEAIYNFGEVGNLTHQSGNWSELESSLQASRSEHPGERQARQKRFDALASPLRAAQTLVQQVLT